MRRNPLLLGDRIKRVINRDLIVVSHVSIGGVLLLSLWFDTSLDQNQKIGILLLLAALGALGISRVLNAFRINNYPMVHLTLYHILIAIGLITFAMPGSVYVFTWIILILLVNFFYGYRATIVSLASLLLVLEWQLIRQGSQAITASAILTNVAQFIIIATIAVFLIDTEAVTDQDRRLLMTSMDKAQLERQRLVALINSMVDGVIATDDAGIVRLHNAAALDILDTNIDLQGKNINNFLHVIDKNDKKVNVIRLANKTNALIRSTDYRLQYPDEEIINLHLSISPIRLGFRHNAERGFIFSFRDITREKSLEQESDEFISVISHELRTPVAITEANLSNALFINQKSQDSEAINKALIDAHKQSIFLAILLNDLSTLSRAERGKLEMTLEEVDPRELTQGLYDDYHTAIENKGLKMTTVVEPSTPNTVTTSKLYTREMLQNFITNATKYTKEGTINVSCAGKDNGVVFTIKDTGIGISKSDQKKIFEKFFRSEDYRTRESSGTGLGLYITKKLAKLLNADIQLESQLNAGSTFTIYIPNMTKPAPRKDVISRKITAQVPPSHVPELIKKQS